MPSPWGGILTRLGECRWEIPADYKPGMRVPGLIFASEAMLGHILEERALEQVANVAFLPGIVGHSLAMPDIHWGYGFPIGGVAATRVADGVVSPGGVGFDINCGVRLLRTDLMREEVAPRIDALLDDLYMNVPSGLGSRGRIRLSERDLEAVLAKGGQWALEAGYGEGRDTTVTEEGGWLKNADPNVVSPKARKRGAPQLGTLGSGNHFLEIEAVEEIYDPRTAEAMGITQPGQVLIMIHTGSRGLGHQVCSDYLKVLAEATRRYAIDLPDRQLACAPIDSNEGQEYLKAMACAANYAWANRQCIAHWVRQSFMRVLGQGPSRIGLEQVYDVCHNIAKIETHTVEGKKQKLCVHRKGATRAFQPHHPILPTAYKDIGQPVLIPGDMGRYSFIAVGTEGAMRLSFGSTCHGAGRLKSRGEAKRSMRGEEVMRKLKAEGITVRAGSIGALAEEASPAYKDVAEVVEAAHKAGISRRIIKSAPMGVIKG